jgi:hypothetical protein
LSRRSFSAGGTTMANNVIFVNNKSGHYSINPKPAMHSKRPGCFNF